MKIFIVVGESSGDLLAAGLIKELQAMCSNIEVRGVVGPNLIAVGAKRIYDMRHLSLMGLIDPLLHLPKLIYIRHKVYKHVIAYQPDVFIGVDSPEFNLGLEKKLKQANITTVHYVSPSVWAWRTSRVKLIKQAVDLMLTLFPFELDFYRQHKVNAIFVGHPLADQIPMIPDHKLAKQQLGFAEYDKILAIMPGSRNSELQHLAHIYLQVAAEIFLRFPFVKFLVPVTSVAHKIYIEQLIAQLNYKLPIKILLANSHSALDAADLVLVTSGTATLEAMLYKKPMVVAFKTNWLTYWVVKQLIQVKHIALPNLLADDPPVVPEFIQEKATIYQLRKAVSDLIINGNLTVKQSEVFAAIHKKLRKNANVMAAQAILDLLSCKQDI